MLLLFVIKFNLEPIIQNKLPRVSDHNYPFKPLTAIITRCRERGIQISDNCVNIIRWLIERCELWFGHACVFSRPSCS
jgi:hypothetical protein